MNAAVDGAIRCGYCGRSFTEDRGQPACRTCPLGDACRSIRCPHCGYENPVEPAWLRTLRRWWRRDESGYLVP